VLDYLEESGDQGIRKSGNQGIREWEEGALASLIIQVWAGHDPEPLGVGQRLWVIAVAFVG
jgi:hypothetical protein